MIKKNTLLLFVVLLLCFNNPVMSFDEAILDPLDLTKKDKKVETHIRKIFKKAYITAITADRAEDALVVTAIPEINSTTKSNGNVVEIEFPNCYLHKSISNRNYNWNLKLRNQYPDIMGAQVYRDDHKNKVVVQLEFDSPVKIIIKRVNPSKIKYVFEKLKDQPLRNTSIQDNIEIEAPKYSSDLKKYTAKPSGKYITIEPNSRGYVIESKSNPDVDKVVYDEPSRRMEIKEELPAKKSSSKTEYTSKNTGSNSVKTFTKDDELEVSQAPDIQKEKLPPVADPTDLNDFDVSGPQKYSRSDNAFSDKPKSLPPLQRPEEYQNNLMGQNDYADILKIAMSFEAQGRHQDSIQKFSQAINVNPNRYEAYSALGDIYLRLQRDNLAIENYVKSLNLNENQPKVIYNLGTAYANNNENFKAIQQFKKVLEVQPSNYSANYHLANQYYLKKDSINAIKYYEVCLNLSKKSKNYIETSKIYYNLANTYREMKKYSKAVDYYKKSLKLFKEFADAHYNLAATYVDLGNYKSAIEEFEAFKKYATSQSEIDKVNKIIDQLKG